MSGAFTLGSDRAFGIVGAGKAAVVTNGNTTGTIYVGKSPSTGAGSNDYSIAAGTSQLVNGPAYAVGSTNVLVGITESYVPPKQAIPTTRWWVGDTPTDAASGGGAAKTTTIGTIYFGEVDIPQRCTLTGVGALLSTAGTEQHIGVLYDWFGKPLAWSAIAGSETGTSNTYDSYAFIAPYEVLSPGKYWVGVGSNAGNASLQVQNATTGIAGALSVFGGTMASGWTDGSAPVAITPATTVGEIPVAYVY